jgi:DNA helicase-4
MELDDFEQLDKISKDIEWNKKLRKLSLFCYLVIIGFFVRPGIEKKLVTLHQEQENLISRISSKFSNIHHENQEIHRYLYTHNTFLVYPKKLEILSNLQKNLEFLKKSFNHRNILPVNITEQIIPHKNDILTINAEVVQYNENFVRRRIKEYNSLFQKSPYPLDENQKRAVIIDDCHNLIVAGAGSGKTEVIINRIAYLLERKPDTISPEKILVLAYQNKAANEIQERLLERYKINVKIKTFHALGKEICEYGSRYSNEEIPKLKFSGDNADIQFSGYIRHLYQNSLNDPHFEQLIWNFLLSYGDSNVYKSESDFDNPHAYYEYAKNLQYTTLTGVKVKSKAECEVFNFYFTHRVNGKNIEVRYESPAEWMKYSNAEGMEKVPHPDFFLPGFNIYHETLGNRQEWKCTPLVLWQGSSARIR